MKHLFSILILTFLLFSCSKDDEPKTTIQVIDKTEVQITNINTSAENYTTVFEYNGSNEISKISLFRNGSFQASHTYTYENNIPVSAQYFNLDDDENYLINYNYTNGVFSSISYPTFNTNEIFTHDQITNEYVGSGGGLNFRINTSDDISYKSKNNTPISYEFDSSKKGPFYNVTNKKWIAMLWYTSRLDAYSNNVTTTYPVVSYANQSTSVVYDYENTYDANGFVSTSEYSNSDGSIKITIKFTYKYI